MVPSQAKKGAQSAAILSSSTRRVASPASRVDIRSANENQPVEEIINLTQAGYAMNFIADVSHHIKAVELRVDPIIIRVNEFDEESSKEFVDLMSRAQNTGQTIIPVIIDSYGGQVYSLMAMISAIKASRIPVATIVEGKAMSCGALLFSFGAEGMRYMDPDATLMVHDVSSGSFGKVEEIKTNAKEVERLNRKVYEMMARNCGKPSDYFLKLVHEKGHADWYLDSQEAKLHNIANELRVPTLTCKIELNYVLD
jgi:ATP-dependent Clp endopeptidase proteolytic subunit ClpP